MKKELKMGKDKETKREEERTKGMDGLNGDVAFLGRSRVQLTGFGGLDSV